MTGQREQSTGEDGEGDSSESTPYHSGPRRTMNYRFDLSTGLSEIKGLLMKVYMKVSEHFDSSELNCHHCNQPGVKPELIANLEKIRAAMGMPINVHSGYRCAHHPIEAKNKTPGQHTMGIGADISVKGMGIEDLFLIIGGMPEIQIQRACRRD